MATTLYLRDVTVSDQAIRSTDSAKLNGSASGWHSLTLAGSRGATLNTTQSVATVAGATAGIELEQTISSVTVPVEWISGPVDADVTISGSITFNLWAWESAMNANAAINVLVEKLDGKGLTTLTTILKTTRTTELGTSAAVLTNFAQTPGAGVTLNKGDRLRVTVFADDAGTMGSGFTVSNRYGGGTGGSGTDGDSFITFTETFTTMGDTAAGTTVYLTNTAAGINPGSGTELEAWTSGSSVGSSTIATATGWARQTDTSEWYTKPLQAFTLAGPLDGNIRASVSSVASMTHLGIELALCDIDGNFIQLLATNIEFTALTTSTGVYFTSDPWGIDDVSVTDGQRIRIRIFAAADDASAMVTGHTVTVNHASSGPLDSYVTFTQTLTEYVPPPSYTPRNPGIDSALALV